MRSIPSTTAGVSRPSSPSKHAILAFFHLAQRGAQLRSGRFDTWCARHPRLAKGCAWLAAWALISLWRWDVVTEPPYWDSAMGLFTEASFLADHDFDYHRLAFEERRFAQGGSAVYLISLLPTLVALVMRCTASPVQAFVVCHLLTFGCAAALAISVASWVARGAAGWWGGGLVALVALTTPLVATQIDMLGMDLPMTCACIAAARQLTSGRYLRAAGWSAVAFALKQTGGLMTVAAIVFLAARWLLFDRQERRVLGRGVVAGVVAHALLLDIQLCLVELVGRLPYSRYDHLQRDLQFGLLNLLQAARWCPETALAIVALVVVLAVRLLSPARSDAAGKEANWSTRVNRWRAGWGILFDREGSSVLAAIVVLGMLAMLSFLYTIPRYLVLPCVFAWVGLGCWIGRIVQWRAAQAALAGLVLCWNVLNASGRWLPIAETPERTGAILERSREYLVDHRANRALVDFLVEHAAEHPIVVGNPVVYFLSLPRLGYVARPLSGYALHAFTSAEFPRIERILSDRPGEPWWVDVTNSFQGTGNATEPRLAAGDEVLWRAAREPLLAVFRRPALATPDLAARELLLRQTLFPETLSADDPFRLAAEGRLIDAAQVLRTRLKHSPDDLDLRHNLGVVLAKSKDLAGAEAQLRQVVAADARRDASWDQLGTVLADADRADEASQALEQAVRLAPRQASYHLHLGHVRLRQQRAREAAAEFQMAETLDRSDPSAPYFRGMALRIAGDTRQSLSSFQEAVKRNPELADGHYQLALVYDECWQSREAVAHYRRALLARPGWIEPANNLAWILATHFDPALRQGAEAVAWAEQVARTAGTNNPALLDTLAAAYAEAGQFENAVATAERAILLTRQAGQPTNDLESRRQLYAARQPFHVSRPSPMPLAP